MKETQFISTFFLVAVSLIFNAIAFPSHVTCLGDDDYNYSACLGNDKMVVSARTQVRDPMQQWVEKEDLPLVRRGTLYIVQCDGHENMQCFCQRCERRGFWTTWTLRLFSRWELLWKKGKEVKGKGKKDAGSLNYITVASPEASEVVLVTSWVNNWFLSEADLKNKVTG